MKIKRVDMLALRRGPALTAAIEGASAEEDPGATIVVKYGRTAAAIVPIAVLDEWCEREAARRSHED